ncbi:hypothetical protein LZ757_03225 [Xylella fastidiosa subsp. morus]|uniref:hypothetical protein n=1 Tax=Xylella fastidiosa TaxID=2371 RepID=UPI0003ECDCA2|nr:hypothetical protein [Xylella fastidiosa]AIC13880.1 hypothetical protein P303_07755 [Xylella fastidiosa MUL0034]EWG15061.1 hypothetical protein P910_001360 [Xylella fastidiosa Mul-MD]UIN28520.1 hypothetical protein IUD23_03210 [Xylella fastidiosa subsp. morus]UIT37263.1 hypothetical protein LZ757_03225 [Xylella fastidiosa subsp. morus]UIT39558.1 hypothetical protein LZ755_03235 [Xylella fastidiosa subsp. morus]
MPEPVKTIAWCATAYGALTLPQAGSNSSVLSRWHCWGPLLQVVPLAVMVQVCGRGGNAIAGRVVCRVLFDWSVTVAGMLQGAANV